MAIQTATYKDYAIIFNGIIYAGDGREHTINEVKIVYPCTEGYKWFSGISRDSSLGWEEATWASQPARSATAPFAMTNIDNIQFGSVPQCQVTFPLLSYEDFIEMQKVLHQRTVIMTFFNMYTNEWITREMAITGNERGKIHNRGTTINGVTSVKVKFVSTQRYIDYNSFKISYIVKSGETGNNVEKTYSIGSVATILNSGTSQISKTGKTLLYWKECDKNGTILENGILVLPDQKITVFTNYNLTAVWG